MAGALFLGCEFAEDDELAVCKRGGIVFPAVPDVPVDTYRTALYTANELYALRRRTATHWTPGSTPGRAARDPERALAQALHDHAIDEALADWIERTPPGRRDGRARHRARPARLRRGGPARPPARRRTRRVATGGGPGAMEAANLGAWLSGRDADEVDEARGAAGRGAGVPPSVGPWARAAFAVREQWPDGGDSLGIPTWHYGHEPPNAFASAIAKYFHNATREAILLAGVRRGHRVPARRRRHGAGDLPGRLRELLRRRRPRWRRWCWSAGRTGPRTCPPGRCSRSSPGAGRWRTTSTSSTPSRRPRPLVAG